MTTATYLVTGMTCDHCARAVTEQLRSLEDVRDVMVELVPGGQSAVVIVSAAPLTTDAVADALDDAGEYQLVSSN